MVNTHTQRSAFLDDSRVILFVHTQITHLLMLSIQNGAVVTPSGTAQPPSTSQLQIECGGEVV